MAAMPATSPSQDVARRLVDEGYVVVSGLLGYDIYPPFVGYVDGRHPRRVLSADS